MVQANITSRLDYCIGLLYGLPNHLIGQLQSPELCSQSGEIAWRIHPHYTNPQGAPLVAHKVQDKVLDHSPDFQSSKWLCPAVPE